MARKDWNKMNNRDKAAVFDFMGIPHGLKVRAPQVRQDNPLNENHVIREVSELLAVHPKVLFAVRQNSGGASYEAASGKFAPIMFYKVLTGQDLTITDFWGIMRDGRMLAIEAKRRDWKEPKEPREFRQAAFLMLVRNAGGVAGFVRGTDEAKLLLDQS